MLPDLRRLDHLIATKRQADLFDEYLDRYGKKAHRESGVVS